MTLPFALVPYLARLERLDHAALGHFPGSQRSDLMLISRR